MALFAATLAGAAPALAAPAAPAGQETQTTLPATVAPRGHTTPLNACMVLARPGDTTRRMFALLAHRPCPYPNGYPPSQGLADSYWMLLHPFRAGDSLQLPLLAYQPAWQSGAQVSLLHADGTIATLRLENRMLPRFNRGGGYVAVPLPAARGTPVVAMMLRVDHLSPSVNYITGLSLMDEIAAEDLTRSEIRIYALFYGACLTLLISNLLLWLFVRETFQIVFCVNLLTVLAWAWLHGLAPIDGVLHFRLEWLIRALRVAAWLLFWDRALAPGALRPRLRALAMAVAALLMVLALVQLDLPTDWLRMTGVVIACVYTLFHPLALVTLGSAMKRDAVTVRILMLTVLSPTLLYIAHLVQASRTYAYSIDHLQLLALTCESLLSTLAMAVHIKRIIRERDAARAEEIVARRLADIDPLTGLLNRRALLDRLLARAGEARQRLLLVDVDHFKTINDTHGHEIGDTVLRELAALLGRRTQGRFIIGRLGGEEFALVGPAGDLTSAVALGIVNDVRAHHFAGRHRITVSIGTTEGPVTSEAAWSALYRRADSALYAAKGAGRNRVVDLSDEAPVPAPTPPRQRVPARRNP